MDAVSYTHLDVYKRQIPDKMAATDPKTGNTGFIMEEKTKSGKNASVFKDVSIYAKIEDPVTDQTKESSETTYTYYVDKSAFKEGDAIVNQETGERYIICLLYTSRCV